MNRWIATVAGFTLTALLAFEGISTAGDQVTIVRDNMGVPHVYADTAEALFYGVGYAVAEDRLVQLEMIRRLAQGRMSEVFGKSYLESDKEARVEGYTADELRQQLAPLAGEQRLLFTAITKGLNRYIAEAQSDPDAKMPFEFKALGTPLQPFDEIDVLSITVYLTRFFGGSGGRELTNQQMLDDLIAKHGEATARQIFDDVLVLNDPDAYTNVPVETDNKRAAANTRQVGSVLRSGRSPAGNIELAYNKATAKALARQWLGQGASRSLVIGAERSASGHPLMMQATADGYDLHIHGAGFDAAGLAMGGSLPVMGRGKNHGWLITTGENDVIDIFEEHLNLDDPEQYRFNDEWKQMESRVETIDVRGGKPVELTVYRTVHGPVVAWNKENHRAYSLRHSIWMQEAHGRAARMAFCKANSPEEFAAAVAEMRGNMNVSYADTDGHLEQWHTGLMPIRAEGVDPRLPTPGTGTHEWQGFVKFEDRPHVVNPKRGFLLAWNSKPTAETTYGDSARWGKHFRTYLPLQLAASDESVTLEDMQRFNRTIGAAFASVDLSITDPKMFEQYIRAAIDDPQADSAVKNVAEQMLDWDGQYVDADGDETYDHPGLAIYRQWVKTASEMILQDDLDEWWHKFDDGVYIKYRTSVLLRAIQGDDAGQPMRYDFFNGQDKQAVLRQTLAATAEKLAEQFDSQDVASWKQPIFWRCFGSVPKELKGRGYRNRIAGLGVQLGHITDKVHHNGMPGWTCIMELDENKRSIQSLIPTGGQCWFVNTKRKAGPHINDQTLRHRDFDYKTVSKDKARINELAESTTVLELP